MSERNEFTKEPAQSEPETKFPMKVYRYKATIHDPNYEFHYGYINGASLEEAKKKALAHMQGKYPSPSTTITRIWRVSDKQFRKKYGEDINKKIEYGYDRIHPTSKNIKRT